MSLLHDKCISNACTWTSAKSHIHPFVDFIFICRINRSGSKPSGLSHILDDDASDKLIRQRWSLLEWEIRQSYHLQLLHDQCPKRREYIALIIEAPFRCMLVGEPARMIHLNFVKWSPPHYLVYCELADFWITNTTSTPMYGQ